MNKSCPKCSSEIQEIHRFCPACGCDLNKPLICPKCNYSNESNSKFCQECGDSLLPGMKTTSKGKKNIDEPVAIDPVPPDGITIEFPFSTASSFEFAVKEAEQFESFKKLGDGKTAIYRITINEDEFGLVDKLLEQLKGWRKRAVYIKGEKVTWDSIFSYTWCHEKKKSSYKPELYCFGFENEWEFNLWGCMRANMSFSDNSQWFSYGQWVNSKGDWEFDKKRIKHELEKNLYQFRFCPAINLNHIQDIIDALPDSVNPSKNKNWKFMESYDSEPEQGLVVKINRYGFEEKVVMKGVCPNGKSFINEIKSRMKSKLPNGL